MNCLDGQITICAATYGGGMEFIMKKQKNSGGYRSVQAVDRAIGILDYIADHANSASIAEICEGTSLNYSTAYNLLRTLRMQDYVCQDFETGRFSIGPAIFKLSRAIKNSSSITKEAIPEMRRLSEKYNETCQLGVLANNKLVYIGRVDCEREVRLASYIGKQIPPHMTSMGKALLAYLPERERTLVVESLELQMATPHTITDRKVLYDELARIRQQGYATDDEENVIGIHCFGAPVFDSRARAVAAVSIVFLKERLSSASTEEVIRDVKATALNISQRLGYFS